MFLPQTNQKRHLKKLLCVHGRNSFIRSSGVVQYSFYKNICYNLIFVWYAFYSGFTGQVLYFTFQFLLDTKKILTLPKHPNPTHPHEQTIFDSWVLSSFNVFFTSLPPLLYGLFERDLSEETIYNNPKTYRRVQSGSVFTFTTFAGWMFSAVWHSLGTHKYYLLLS